ncbi:uncharacterized protein KGF55_004712 [Candida pseudojiufengensis]|uniref:uncharacterized protein n=1 Tax=Candida pseudojiufengensis TaxID=497109 RepID=UPI0022257FC4|nr:uncharacterized protein KGF55_004712 [Candida pseudojiufengensis]KAI5960420.1 hypothetical protein KGF55_004712 [Candida pseudojiufengensis]
MDFCYNKSMGNGTVASKFRLTSKIQSNQSNLRTPLIIPKADGINNQFSPLNQITPQQNNNNKQTIELKNQTTPIINEEVNKPITTPKPNLQQTPSPPIENNISHHPSNCNRCYRLKKKCTRAYPKCSHCERTGSDCEYVDRSKKRRKVVPANVEETKIDGQIVHIADTSKSKELVEQKLISISSLLADSNDEQVKKREMSKNNKIPTAALASSARRAQDKERQNIVDKINFKTTQKPTFSNLQEEFITMKEIKENELPLIFAMYYFENFSFKYPFINKVEFFEKLKKINFAKDSIVNLDIYLLLSIGCILYDSKCQTDHYTTYFKTKSILGIIDVLDLSFSTYMENNMELLILLSIYGIASLNSDLVWNLLGLLDRAVVKFELYKKLDTIQTSRIFWSIHNLDKEFSIISQRPSQFPSYNYFKENSITVSLYEEENISIVNRNIKLGMYQDALNDSLLSNSRDNLFEISKNLGIWTAGITKEFSLKYSTQSEVQCLVAWANIQSYYLQTVMDQISTTKNFQFPSNFIFHSFTALITASDKSSEKSKANTQSSIVSSMFWYSQYFNIVRYSIDSLIHFIIEKDNDLELRVKEFNDFLQQSLNMSKFIRAAKTSNTIEGYINLSDDNNKLIEELERVSLKLLGYDVNDDSESIVKLLEDVKNNVKKIL